MMVADGSACGISLARMSRTCAARLQDFVTAVRDLVSRCAGKHMDETGFRIVDPMAACGLYRLAHLLSRLRQTRQPAGRCGRHRGA
jgi:hypothetical protein